MIARPPTNTSNRLRQTFLLLVLVLVNASAPGQTSPVYAWRTLTGQPGGNGNADGTGGVARFFNPSAVAVDRAGNVYVADSGNNTIRKVTTNGVVTTLAGSAGQSGSADGTNNTARFDYPSGVAVDSVGNVYVADTYNSTIRKVTSSGVVTTLVGNAGLSGSADGTRSTALFNFPRSVTVDSAGNLYVADSGNNTIRKVTSGGVVTTLAGSAGVSGSADGTNNTALFFYPSGVAVDGAGNVYVADLDNNCIRQVTSLGAVTTVAGLAQFDHFGNPIGGSADGTNDSARFNFPSGVAVDSAGTVYVADTGNSTIREVTTNEVVTTLAGSAGQFGSMDGTNSLAQFNYPYDVAVDSAGNVYVADFGNSTIRKVTSSGVVTTLAGSGEQSGSVDVTGSTARFNYPVGMAVDRAGTVYVADSGNNTIREVTSNGVVTTLAGSAGQSGSADGTNSLARFSNPFGAAVDTAGNVYVADTGNNTIRKVTSGGVVTTLAGSAGLAGSADGTNSLARFSNPSGVAVDNVGNVYVADSGNKIIRLITSEGAVTTLAGSEGRFSYPFGVAVDSSNNLFVTDTLNNTIWEAMTNGVLTTLAGSAGQPGTTDGTGSAARFFGPGGLTVDSAGNLYVADTGNNTIRKVTSGGVVTTVAGSAGQSGSADDIISAARYFLPNGVAVDGAGNVYVADTYNSTIRKMTSDGGVTTLAGSAGLTGITDGMGGAALFNYPSGVAVDSMGNVYVADSGNNTIRKVTSGGMVTTLAGSADGTGDAAQFNYPTGVAVDSMGNVYVADSGNNTIRKVTSGGMVTTLAGNAGLSGSADGTNGTALFDFPRDVAVDSAGNVYVADSDNDTIRKVTGSGVVTTIGGNPGVIGGADGIGASANFAGPDGVAVDANGRIYVADSGNNRISKGTPMPVLSITASAMGISVSWPTPFTGFVLQQNSDLGNALGWSTTTYNVSDDGTNDSITVLSPAGNLFFRLTHP